MRDIECFDGTSLARYSNDTGALSCLDFGLRQLLILPTTCPEGQSLNHEGECKEVTRLGQGAPKRRRKRRLATGSLGLKSFLRQRFAGK